MRRTGGWIRGHRRGERAGMRGQFGHQFHGGHQQAPSRGGRSGLTAAGAKLQDAERLMQGSGGIRESSHLSQELIDALVVRGLHRARVAARPGGLAGVEGSDPGRGGCGVSHDAPLLRLIATVCAIASPGSYHRSTGLPDSHRLESVANWLK